MKRLLNGFAAIYICLALFVAHSALVTTEASATRHLDTGSVVVEAGPAVRDHQRLAGPEQTPRTDRSCYIVEVWTASWCGPCRRYKATELPALVKAGFTVTVKDYDTDKPPKDVKKVPTIRIYYKGTYLQQKTYWRAEDIVKYVDNRMALKG